MVPPSVPEVAPDTGSAMAVIYPTRLCSGSGQSCFRLLSVDYSAAVELLRAWNYTSPVRLPQILPTEARLLVLGLEATPLAVVMGRLLPGRFQAWVFAHEPALADVWRQQLLLKVCLQASAMGVNRLEIVTRPGERLPMGSRAIHVGKAQLP